MRVLGFTGSFDERFLGLREEISLGLVSNFYSIPKRERHVQNRMWTPTCVWKCDVFFKARSRFGRTALARFCSALLRALVATYIASKSGLAESRRGGGAQIANAHCFETWDEAAKLAHMRIAYAPSRLMEVCEREYLAGQRRIIKLLMRGIPFRISVGAVVITL